MFDQTSSLGPLSQRKSLVISALLALMICAMSVYIYSERETETQRAQTNPFVIKSYKIEWLHIPKCGTTLGETLLSYFCGIHEKGIVRPGKVKKDRIPDWCLAKFRTDQHHRRNWIIGDHFTLHNYTDAQIEKIYTMVRNPGVRVVSGFHFLTNFKRPNATAGEICKFVLQNQKMGHVALGGQTKYIMGSPVTDNAGWKFTKADTPSDVHAERACSLLKKMKFVGITDFWETSSCILANSIGKTYEPSSKIRANPNAISTNRVTCGHDPDWLLYECAWNRMALELEKYPNCKTIFWSEFMGHEGI